MKSLIVCVSVSHGNTRRVADRMAEVLGAGVAEPEAVDPNTVREYDLVGFGSGIYFMAAHARLVSFVRGLPPVVGLLSRNGSRSGLVGLPAFTFFTSGAPQIPLTSYGKAIRNQLKSKGFDVLDSFSCRGFDTVGPFQLVGGLNKGRPDGRDLDRAARFAARLRERVTGSQAAS